MNNSRRNFIKNSGRAGLSLSFLPTLNSFGNFSFDDWNVLSALPRSTPEAQGISSVAISNLLNAIKESKIDWHSFMLVRHGYVVAEAWWKPFAAEFKHTLYSLSKSFTSSAIGLLVKDGKLSVDDLVIKYFSDELPATMDDNLKQMTIKHMLTMNTGHDMDTTPIMREGKEIWTKIFLSLPVLHKPGTHFLYNSGATYMCGAIVQKITGLTLKDFLTARLFKPLGIEGYDWEESPQGMSMAGWGLRVGTEDIAKFGQLYLQKGKWKGKEILTEAWVKDASAAQTTSNTGDSDWSQGYGYQFWRCKPGFFRGDGAFGQFCFVMPQHDAVFAATSESWDLQKSMNTFYNSILPAMREKKLPKNDEAYNNLKTELKNLVLPVPTGSITSSLRSKYNSKKFKLDVNEFNALDIIFDFNNAGCTIAVKTIQTYQIIKFGWEKWVTNEKKSPYVFPVAGRIHVPSKIAGTATWIDEKTLQLNARFVDAVHGDKIICVFEDDKVSISFINSVAENSKNNPDKRAGLVGKI